MQYIFSKSYRVKKEIYNSHPPPSLLESWTVSNVAWLCSQQGPPLQARWKDWISVEFSYITYALHIAMGDNISVFKFVQSRMRSHFLKCYQLRQLQKLLLFSMQGEAVTRCRNTCLYYFQSIATMLPTSYDTTMGEWFVPSINSANVLRRLRPVTVANYVSVYQTNRYQAQKKKGYIYHANHILLCPLSTQEL